MILVFTGNGKGKTTAALGQGLRAVGQGRRVACFQFVKSPEYPSGEDVSVRVFGNKFRIVKGGRGFVGILGDALPRRVHKEAARATLKMAHEAASRNEADMVILDEISVALSLRLIPKREALRVVKAIAKREIDLVLTGRGAPPEFIALADIVTHVREVKHAYRKGARARKGIEY